jgi:hypothetical protein
MMYELWTFVSMEIVDDPDAELDICKGCKHAGTDWEDEPCATCSIAPTHWEIDK